MRYDPIKIPSVLPEASNIPPMPKLKAPKHKIIQILCLGNALLGLGSDGVVYIAKPNSGWQRHIDAL